MKALEWLFLEWLHVLWKGFYILAPLYLIFWVVKPRFLQKFRIFQPKEVSVRTKKEFPFAVLGISVYVVPLFLLMILKVKFNYTVMYSDINEYGLFYYFFSFFIFVAVIDTWFYWSHRAMHSWKWLKKYHVHHHNSYNITPMTSFSFHLVEALLIMMGYALFVLTVPFHFSILAAGGTWAIFYNGYIHLGYDIPNSWRRKFPPLKILYLGRQHSIHHHEYNYNFAAYFSFWDWIMKTDKYEHTKKSRETF